MGPAMPFGRYFRFAGSALLSFLYLVDWYMPRLAAEPAHSQVVRSTIRIHSEHQWPKAVAIDTNVKTINPTIAVTLRRRRLIPVVLKTNLKMRLSLMLLGFFLNSHLNQSVLRLGLRSSQCETFAGGW